MNLKKYPELIPLVDWWQKDGKKTVLMIAVAVIAIGGYYGWKHRKAAAAGEARQMLMCDASQLEEVVSLHGESAVGYALKLRLAQRYYGEGQYEQALEVYDGLNGQLDEAYAPIAQLGRVQCLEALSKFAEAKQGYEDFLAGHGQGFLELDARLGAARCMAQLGDAKAALAALAAEKDKAKGDVMVTQRIEETESAIKWLTRSLAKTEPAKK